MHQNTLNSSQVSKILFQLVKGSNYVVHCWIWLKFKLIRDFIDVLLACKNEEVPTKNEGTKVFTTLNIGFKTHKGR